MLMEQLDYNLLFRWFMGLNMDDAIWDVTVFTKNRERLLDGDIAEAFFQAVLQQARERSLLSELQRESAGGEPQRPNREHGGVRGQRNGRARCRAGDAGTDSGNEAGDRGRRQGIRHGGFRGRVPKPKGHAARGPKPGTAWWECD